MITCLLPLEPPPYGAFTIITVLFTPPNFDYSDYRFCTKLTQKHLFPGKFLGEYKN